MATGYPGSEFCGELNRLANGGTYPNRTLFLDDQGAANKYAGTTGLGVVGALNKKVSSSRQPSAYKGLQAVCNELAGTTDKSPVAALRSINI